MRKKNTLMLILSLIMIVASATTLVFAWFSIVEKTQEILIYSGTIKLEANLYKDEINSNNIINEINYDNFVPGDNYTYYLELIQVGNIEGDLNVDFNFSTNNNNLLPHLKFSIIETTKYKKDVSNNYIKDDLFSNSPYNDTLNNITNLKYNYNTILDESEKIVIEFKIDILSSLELSHLVSGLNSFSISSININLEQGDIFGG